MDHIIGAGVRVVSKSIAVVSEVAVSKRDSKNTQTKVVEEKADSDSDADEDILSREQDLDDAIGDDSVEQDQRTLQNDGLVSLEAANYLANNQQDHPSIISPIPQSVILPQRRPKTRSRGFIRAYPPVLGECSGINQATFMKFLADFDQAAKAWPIFMVINIAANGIGLVPEASFMAASTAMSAAAYIGEELQTRYQTNDFLEKVNKVLFKPRKLCAFIMTYQPNMSDDAFLRADLTDPHAIALTKTLDREAGNSLQRTLSRFKKVSSGTTKHESQMFDPAPLIYPALDQALLKGRRDITNTTTLTQTSNTSSSLQPVDSRRRASVVQDYLDRRAQAQFIANNPESTLASTLPSQQPKFVNRFADPNHPVNSGSLFGLVTGGTWDPIANGRVRRARKKAKSKGEPPLTESETHDAYMGRTVRDRVTGTPSKKIFGLKKYFEGSVLYLVITNLPEAAE